MLFGFVSGVIGFGALAFGLGGAGLSAASTEPQSFDHQATGAGPSGLFWAVISEPPPSGLPSAPTTR